MLLQHRLRAPPAPARRRSARPCRPQRDEAERGERAVGAVGHRGIDAGDLFGRGAQGRRRVAARQGQQLSSDKLEAVGRLEGRQRRRALDELRRGGELDLPPAAT